MEALSAVKDIVKYRIVSAVNTGDKTYDNLINTLLLILIAKLFDYTLILEKVKKLAYCIFYYRKRDKNSISAKDFQYHVTEIQSRTFEGACFVATEQQALLTTYVVNNFTSIVRSYTEKVFDLEKKEWQVCELSLPSSLKDLINTYPQGMPIFIKNDKYISIKCNNGTYIMYETEEVLREFSSFLTKKDTETANTGIAPVQYLHMNGKNTKYYVYIDRTFDNWVSMHKEEIVNALNDFQYFTDRYTHPVMKNGVAVCDVSKYNANPLELGYFNLGFILYGVPGTGKTSLIKAICNYLKRDAYIVDMRKIKTRADFEGLFTNFISYVYVLDEIDCVPGFLTREKGDSQTPAICFKEEKKELQQSLITHLTLLSSTTDLPTKDNIRAEIAEIKTKIADLENALSIDTILQVLDGMREMRGRVIVATTNYIDRIDPAILRAGRFDFKIHLTYFTDKESRELLSIIFSKKASEEEFEYLKSKRLREGEFTPTQIIHLAHRHRSLKKVVDIMSEA